MLENYLKAIKAYDIRWIFNDTIDEKFVYILWRAIWKYFKNKYWPNWKFMIAKDVRPANDKIIPFFIQGLIEMWLENIDYIWLCSTAFAYHIWHNYDLCVNFTASHNPPEYVWLKFFDWNTKFLSQSFLKDIFTKEYNNIFNSSCFYCVNDDPQSMQNTVNLTNNLLPEISEKTKKVFDNPKNVKNQIQDLYNFLEKKYNSLKETHKFVVDFSNWAACNYEKMFFKKLQQKWRKIKFINENPDWTFPNHLSDTQEYENYEQVIQEVKNWNFEFWIMFDWDADRLWIALPNWEVCPWDVLLTIFSKQILKEKNLKNENIVYEVMCSKTVKEEIEKLWSNWILYKMWRFFIKEKMDETNAILWWETSWHFMFREIWGYEMPLLALYYFIKELEELKNDSNKILEKYKKYPKTPVISKKVTDKNQVINRIKKQYNNYEQKHIDWVSVFSNDFWFNVRCSNTENKVRFTIEANNQKTLEEEKQKLEKLIY